MSFALRKATVAFAIGNDLVVLRSVDVAMCVTCVFVIFRLWFTALWDTYITDSGYSGSRKSGLPLLTEGSGQSRNHSAWPSWAISLYGRFNFNCSLRGFKAAVGKSSSSPFLIGELRLTSDSCCAAVSVPSVVLIYNSVSDTHARSGPIGRQLVPCHLPPSTPPGVAVSLSCQGFDVLPRTRTSGALPNPALGSSIKLISDRLTKSFRCFEGNIEYSIKA